MGDVQISGVLVFARCFLKLSHTLALLHWSVLKRTVSDFFLPPYHSLRPTFQK